MQAMPTALLTRQFTNPKACGTRARLHLRRSLRSMQRWYPSSERSPNWRWQQFLRRTTLKSGLDAQEPRLIKMRSILTISKFLSAKCMSARSEYVIGNSEQKTIFIAVQRPERDSISPCILGDNRQALTRRAYGWISLSNSKRLLSPKRRVKTRI